MDDPMEQTMEGPKGRGRRASTRPQKPTEEPVVPGTQEAEIPPQDGEDISHTENTLDVSSDPKPTLPSEGSFTETSPYFSEATPQTSTRRLRPRTFRSPIKVPPLLQSRRVTRSASTTTPRAQKQEQMTDTSDKAPEMSKGDKSSKTPKQASSKKASKETSDKSSKDTSKTPSKTPSKTQSKTQSKTSSKQETPEKPPKASTRKAKDPTTTDGDDSDLVLKYGDSFDWEEYASFCMRRTRLPTDPSVTTVIENIKLYGNWKGEKRSSSSNNKPSSASKKQNTAETSATATAESKEEKRRTKEERKIEKELKKQRREERRRKKEEKKLKKERDGESKKKHRHKKKHQEGGENGEEGEESGSGVTTEETTPNPQEPASSPEVSGNTTSETTKPAKSRKRKSDDSETPKPKRSKKSTAETVDVENANTVEEPKSTTKQRKSPAKTDASTALETVSESVLNLGSNSPSKRVPAGTSIIVPPPVDADRFGLIQEEVCHNPYYLLIATVFLQKTKASSAIPVFREFLRRWPTPGDLLANGTMGEVKEMFDPLGLHTTRAKTVWMMAHHFYLLDPYKKPRGPQSWAVRRDYRPEDPTGLNRKWGCIIGDVYGCGTYAIDSWRIFCMNPGEGGFIDGTTVGKPQKRKTDDEDTLALPVVVFGSNFSPGDEEWRKISPDREVLDKELQAYIRWMHAKDAAGFGTVMAEP